MPKFKFARALTQIYSENGQVNPIRWEIMFLNEDGVTMEPQTGKFKCKDFFNDVVCKIQTGVNPNVYSMDFSSVKLNSNGVWCRVTEIQDPEHFKTNIDKTVNDYLEEPISVTNLTKTSCLLFFPLSCFDNTYKISLITWLIRVSNFGDSLESLNSVLDSSKISSLDCPFNEGTRNKIRKWKFTVPEDAKKYWFYAGTSYNSITLAETLYINGHTIHNNGVQGFSFPVGE